MSLTTRLSLVAIAAVVSLQGAAIGQIDTFSDLTTMNWFVPGASPNPPANNPTGGPAGAGDPYLLLTSNGNPGAGGRLAVLNDDQWAGDYLAAGITTIHMDVSNFGPDDLYLRLLLEDFAGIGPPVNLALTQAAFVPAGSGWQKVSFSLQPADLVALIGTANDVLANVDTLRIFHNPDPTFPGPGVGIPLVNAAVGVDNITAAGVPEPGTMGLLLTGLTFSAVSVARKHWSK